MLDFPGWVTVCSFSRKDGESVPDSDLLGVRVWHKATGALIDVLFMPFTPQALIYFDTPSRSDRGEAHIQEHVLLGKGKRAKYVRTLEEMALATATAFTGRKRTSYTVQSISGVEAFYEIIEGKLEALLHPSFCDEDVVREVCHMVIDADGKAEEKGTVYSEQVSAYQQPRNIAFNEMYRLVYGDGHPLSYEQGGTPAGIRGVTPHHQKVFHDDNYRLDRVGVVFVSPLHEGSTLAQSLASTLTAFDGMLTRLQAMKPGLPGHVTGEARPPDLPPYPVTDLPPYTPLKRPSGPPKIGQPPLLDQSFPDPSPAPPGTTRIVRFPNHTENEAGLVVLAWPATLHTLPSSEWVELALVQIFSSVFGNGSTSTLHQSIVLSAEASRWIGATAVSCWLGESGRVLYVSLAGVPSALINEEYLSRVSDHIIDSFKRVQQWEAGSDELADFNSRVESEVCCNNRQSIKFLQSPPGFGVRGNYDQWLTFLDTAVEFSDSPTVDLSYAREAAAITGLLKKEENIWGQRIERWGLLQRPIAVGCVASKELLEEERAKTEERERKFVDEHKDIDGYRREYARRSKVIEEATTLTKVPSFTSSPPMNKDPELQYTMATVGAWNRPFLISTTSALGAGAHFGLALSLNDIPKSMYVYASALGAVIDTVGVRLSNGVTVQYKDYCCRVRESTLYVHTHISSNVRTGRVELVFRGAGLNLEEAITAVGWVTRLISNPYWEEDNLPRIRDAVMTALEDVRGTMQLRAEFWGTKLGDALLYQNQLHLAMDCFLTRQHALHRMTWMLRDPSPEVAGAVKRMAGSFCKRTDLMSALADFVAAPSLTKWPGTLIRSEGQLETLKAACEDLSRLLPDMPSSDAVPREWAEECQLLGDDLLLPPRVVLESWHKVLRTVGQQCNVRAFLAAGESSAVQLEKEIRQVVDSMPRGHPPRPPSTARGTAVTERAAGRSQCDVNQRLFALVNESSSHGMVMHSDPCITVGGEQTDDELLDLLAVKAWCGGGAHTLFVHTWGAGLAYSSGLGCSCETGRMMYYADHCRDVVKTLLFAEGLLRSPPKDIAGLGDYALCQCVSSRAGSAYEARCEAMALDEADGIVSKDVEALRSRLISLRPSGEALLQRTRHILKLFKASRALPDSLRFVVGNTEQVGLYVRHLSTPIHVLHPSDFWIVRDTGGSAALPAVPLVLFVALAAAFAAHALGLPKRAREFFKPRE